LSETKLHIVKLEKDRWKEWDTFVLAQRDGTIFHTTYWLREQRSMKPGVYGLFQGDKLVGGVPLCLKEKWGIRITPQPLITPYCGPVLSDVFIQNGLVTEAVKLILNDVYSRFDACRFSLPPQAHQLREALIKLPFHKAGSRSITNLRTNRKARIAPDDLIDSYTRMSRRNDIRRSMRKGVYAQESTDWETIFRLSEESFRISGREHPLKRDQFLGMAGKLHELGLCTGVIAFSPEKVPIAAAWTLSDRHTCYNVLAGVDQEYRKLNGGSVALHEAIRIAMERKLIFDFGGSMMERVNTYLQSYGPEECWFTHCRSVESARFRLLEKTGLVRF